MKRGLLLLTLLMAMLWSADVHATHLMGADMTYTIVGPHQYTVKLSVYRDCNGILPQNSYRIFWQSVACNDTGSFLVSLATGYPIDMTDTCVSQHSTCNGGPVYGVQQWLYTSAVINLPANCPDVVLSWASGARNGVINNLTNPLNDPLYINAEVNTSIIDNSPQFLNPLTVNLCLGQLNYINQGGYDANGDSLVYALDNAQGTTGGATGGYPYSPINLNYSAGYTPTRPITSSTFVFDPTTGQITVVPTQVEYDVVKLVVYEYRAGVLIGHVERDMQIEVQNCTDTLPDLSGIGGITSVDTVFTLPACNTSCFTIYSYATDTNKVLTLTVTGQSSLPGATFTVSSGKQPHLTVCWSPTRANAGTFTFTITVKDNACPQPGSNTRSYKVIVPQVYPAGSDQTICQYTTTNAHATGSGSWSILSGNAAPTVLANPTSPTTLITGFTAPGRYNYQWTSDTTCIDTMSIFVTAKPNAGADQTICQYNTATMAATGTGTWTAVSTNPATTTITTPSLATTTITGFTVVGTYSYVWTSAGCSDTANVIVQLKPNAGPDQTICSSVGIVTMAAVGTGTWTAAASNPVSTAITSPTSATTTITGLTTAGTYTYYWTNGCADTMNVTVSNSPVGGADQTTCQYSTATMAASGTGTWTAQTGNPGASVISTPTSPTTVISGFNVAGTYYYHWTNGTGCADTVAVIVSAKPNAGPDQNTCLNTSITMAATGTGIWTASAGNPAATTITSTTSPTTTVSGFTVTGTYAYYWTAGGCLDTVQIIVNPKPNAGPDQTICQYTSTILAGTGTGTWSASAANPATVSFVSTTSPGTSVSGFTVSGVYTLIWSSLGCTDTVLINVTAKPNAGADQTICQYTSATMSATGIGTWTALSTNPAVTTIATPASATTAISGFTAVGTYGFVWTSGGCTDTANVIVTAKPNAGADQITCQYSTATMAATGTGTWTALGTNPATTTITTATTPAAVISGFILPGVYSYIWTSNGCTDTANVTVTAKPSAGADQTVCQYSSATLAALGSGTWTASAANPAPLTFVSDTSPTTLVSGFTVAGLYTLFWSQNGCSDTMLITVTAKPNAGPDQTVCQFANATMAAIGTGTWTALSSNPVVTTITSSTAANTTITGFTNAGTYGYVWTSNGCTDTVNVIVTAKPNAGLDQSFCLPGSTTVTAASGPGVWTAFATNPGSSTIVSPGSLSTVISGITVGGYYSYIWTVNGCTDTTVVTAFPTSPAGPDQTICQYGSIVTAAFGNGTWIPLSGNPATTTIANTSADTTSISGFNVAGTYGFIWSVSPCTDTMYVTVNAKPDAGADQTTCQFSTATMAATGTGTWTFLSGNPAVTTIATPSSPTTSISGFTLPGIYAYVWTSSGCSDTANVVVTSKPNAGPDQTTCQYSTAIMAATGAGSWTILSGNPAATNISNPGSATTTITGFIVAGTYGYIWTSNGCSDTANVIVIAKPNAGADQTTCQYATATMAATGAGLWTILPGNPANTTIAAASSPATAISGFTLAGTYGYIWTSNGCSDTANVIVTAKPNAGADQSTCQYSTATMAASGTGTWTAIGTNPAPTAIANATSPTTAISGFTLAGIYGYIWTANGCSDTANVIVIAKPNAGADQSTCQYSTATMAATGTGTWTILSGNPAATVITSPGSPVTSITGFTVAGTYGYIWTSGGCSDTANVIVIAKPDAGADQTTCQYSTATMAALGTGTWTALAGNPAATVITTPASASTTIIGFTLAGTYGYIWTSNGCSDTASVIVTAKPNAGADQTTCQYSTATMAATGTGAWTAIAGNPASTTIANTTSPTTVISGFTLAGTYSYIWTSNGCSDTANVLVTAKPDAGPDQGFCLPGSAVVTAGTPGPGLWSALATNPGTSTIATPNNTSTVIDGISTDGYYSYVWTVSSCTDTMVLTAYPTSPAGPDQTICQYNSIVTAAFGHGTWIALSTNPAPTVIANANADTTAITGFNTAGLYGYIWSVSPCTDTLFVTVVAKPYAGADQTICQFSTTALAATGTGAWTADAGNPALVSFANSTSPTTSVSGFSASGVYTLYWSLNGCADTVLINVTAKPNAGVDQTICQYSSTSMAATGTGTWTADAANPVVLTFVSATSPVTSVSGFTLPGTYALYWSLNGCSDTVLINVTAKPNAGADQTICQYTSTAMAAAGTGAWTAAANNPAPVNFGNTNSPTTLVSGFTVPGIYVLYWSLNGCSDTTLINVTAKPDAGADQTICQYSSTSLAASGTGTWTADAGNPAVVNFANAGSAVSSVSGFTVSGIYSLYWSLNGCSDTMLINVTAKPDAGADQTLCLPGNITTSASAGAGTWTALPSNPAASSIALPNNPVTVISGFTNGGAYSYIWTVNGCADTMTANIIPLSPAGPDQTTCEYTTITTAAFGNGVWSTLPGNPATTTIASSSSSVTTISGFTAAGSYGYIWLVNGCSDTMNVTVVAKPNAGLDQTICQYSTTSLTATGTGAWTAAAANPATLTFTSTSSPTAQVSGFNAAGIYTLYWTLNGCSDTVLINVTAKPNAGADQTICQYSTTSLSGTGTGTWTADAANPAAIIFANTSSPTSAVSGFTAAGTYTFYWSLNGCSDTVLVNVTAKPDAGLDQTICQYSSTSLAATGTGIWTVSAANPALLSFTSTSDPLTVVSGFTASGVYELYWSLNGCSDTLLIHVTAKPNAGADQTICQFSSASLTATGTGLWTTDASNPAILTFVSTSSPATSVSGFTISGTYILYWSLNGCSDTVLINVTAKPDAGADQTICQYSTASMTATGTGTWSAAASNPAVVAFSNISDPAAIVSGFAASGVYALYWTLNGCSDTVLINVTAKPNAGADQTICQYSTTSLTGTGTGIWTADAGNPATINFVSSTSPTSTVSVFTSAGAYTLYWSLNGCTDTVIINVTAKPDAGPDQTICQYSSTSLSATGTGTWTSAVSNPATVSFANANDPATSVSGFTASGAYALYWSLNGCTDTMIINVTAKPNAGSDQTICQYSTTAMGATGSGTWTLDAGNPALISLVSTADPVTAASGFTTPGVYILYWSLNGCSDTIQISVTAKPDAGPDQNVCQFTTVTMAGVGSGTWTALSSNPSIASISSPSSATTTVSALDSVGIYGFVWTVNGCADTMNITVNAQPTISLRDTAICLNQSASLTPVVTPAGGIYQWSTSSTGASIIVSPSVSTGYTVTYALGICTATASDTVTVNPLPVATISTHASVCTANDGMAIANPSAGTPGYTYTWSAPGGTRDTLNNLAAGSYQVTVLDVNQCSATASATVALQTPAITVTEVSQHNLKCYNDNSGAINIATTDTAGNAATYTYIYSWSNSSNTQNLAGIPAGGYQVTVTDQFGCSGTASYTVTQPAAITGSTSFTNPQCTGYANGSANIGSLSGGSGTYHIAWSTTPVQNTASVTGLTAGSYTVTVTDDSLCQATFTVTLTDPLAITFAQSIVANPTCYGDSNGTITVVPQNGFPPYSYTWSNGQSSNPDTALYPGTFSVRVTDANGCTATTSATLVPVTQLDVNLSATNVQCFGTNTGSITASTSGGTAPYNYLWSNHATTAVISNLTIGTYIVTATDHNGCSASNSASLSQPSKLNETLSSVRTNCPNTSDGVIYDTASGGTGAVTFTLEDASGNVLQSGNTTGTFTGLGYGTYTVIATDQNNCPVSETVDVPRAPFNVYTDSIIGTSCYGVQYHDGIIHLQGYTIPNGPFLYSVDNSPFQSIPDFFDLSAGTHTITAQDNYGCDTTFTVVVPEPLPATLQILPGDSTITAGTSLQLTTDFGPYSVDSIKGYTWSAATGLSCIDCANPIASPYTDQTEYTVTVTYNQGCVVSASIRINANGKPPIYVPNAFTPNGDGVNDEWLVFGTGVKDIKATVFNRWGEKVFESDDQSQGWDGVYRGQAQPPGVYVYIVDIVYLSGEKDTKKGSLTLIR